MPWLSLGESRGASPAVNSRSTDFGKLFPHSFMTCFSERLTSTGASFNSPPTLTRKKENGEATHKPQPELVLSEKRSTRNDTAKQARAKG